MAKTIPSENYQITEEIREILNLVKSSEGNVIFVTGSAGTGKSTLISILKQEINKKMVIVAPTGVAAINSGGQTIHSFFSLAPRPQPKAKKILGAAGKVIKEMEVLIIDEVSMVRADLIDAVADSIRINTGNSPQGGPFAGKTIILIGDLHQLPPIVKTRAEERLFTERYKTPYFYGAESLRLIEPNPIMKKLTKMFRHKDQNFIDLLNNIRVGRDLKNAVSTLNKCCYKNSDTSEPILTLTSYNVTADQINQSRLENIDEPVCTYEATFEGDWKNLKREDRQLPAPRKLDLKRGAQVMFLKNSSGWVNGTIGKIAELGKHSVTVKLESESSKRNVVVYRETWEKLKYTWDKKNRKIKTDVVGAYTQLPFRLAWAVTIHKAQGLTLERVTIDLSPGAFERGQTYVALSRCKTMEGISLTRPLYVGDIKLDESIIKFYSHPSFTLPA